MLLISPFIIIYILAERNKDILITSKTLNELNDISIEVRQINQGTYLKSNPKIIQKRLLDYSSCSPIKIPTLLFLES